MPRIAFIGGGSTVFTRSLVDDFLHQDERDGTRFALMDLVDEMLEAHGQTIPPLR